MSSTGTRRYISVMNFRASSADPPALSTAIHAPSRFSFAPPPVFGFAVMIFSPGFSIRSFQSVMPYGLPWRTTNTMVEWYGSDPFPAGRDSQLSAINLRERMLSTSAHIASVTTSAGMPSMTDRA